MCFFHPAGLFTCVQACARNKRRVWMKADMIINTNMAALNAQRQYQINTDKKSKNTEKLSSGYRINRAADDASGLAVSEKMRRQIRGLDQTLKNLQEGIDLVQIADGAMAEVQDMMQRVNELAVKAANGTHTVSDRANIQLEIDEILDEIDRVGHSTEYNTMKILLSSETALGIVNPGQYLVNFSDTPTFDDVPPLPGYNGGTKTLDFANVNSTNKQYLDGASFSFACTCRQEFSFEFTDTAGINALIAANPSYPYDPATGVLNTTPGASITSSGAANSIKLVINLDNFNDGNGLAANITGYMATLSNRVTTDGSVYAGHNNTIQANGTKITIGALNYAGSFAHQALDVEINGNTAWEIPIQAGIENRNVDVIWLQLPIIETSHMKISSLNVSNELSALKAIGQISKAIEYVSGERGRMGSYQNRMEHAKLTNENTGINTTSAESAIRDTDMAQAMVENAKYNVLEQVGLSMQNQANHQNDSITQLLNQG